MLPSASQSIVPFDRSTPKIPLFEMAKSAITPSKCQGTSLVPPAKGREGKLERIEVVAWKTERTAASVFWSGWDSLIAVFFSGREYQDTGKAPIWGWAVWLDEQPKLRVINPERAIQYVLIAFSIVDRINWIFTICKYQPHSWRHCRVQDRFKAKLTHYTESNADGSKL